jgi:hypothetical protein
LDFHVGAWNVEESCVDVVFVYEKELKIRENQNRRKLSLLDGVTLLSGLDSPSSAASTGPTPTTEGISDLGESSCRRKLGLQNKNKGKTFPHLCETQTKRLMAWIEHQGADFVSSI